MESDSERLEVGALSETGYTRDENQDRMSGSMVPLGHLYIVADGMGGHKGGALAAQMAVEELQRHIGQAAPGDPADTVIAGAFKAANDAVYKKAHSGESTTERMGTTAVLLLISGRIAKLAHVGDSRAYLYRNGALSQLTTDHTIVQRMVQAGMLKPDEASDHPQSSVLERAIGSAQTVEVDIQSHQLQAGDALLLCSDGLSGYVHDAQIEEVLRGERTVQETTADLIRLALDKGGRDNVTVQLVRYGPRTPAPTIRQTRPTKVPPPSAATGGGGQKQRKRGGTRHALPVAAVVIAAVAALVYPRPDGSFITKLTGRTGFTGGTESKASRSVAVPSAPEQQPTAGESKPVAPEASPDKQQRNTPAPNVVDDSSQVLRQRLATKEQELAKTQQRLTAKEQELGHARKRITDLEGQVKELTKTAAAKSKEATPGSPPATPPGPPESAAPAASQPSGATPGVPPATAPGAQEPAPAKPTPEGG
jgi:protein phosphatase